MTTTATVTPRLRDPLLRNCHEIETLRVGLVDDVKVQPHSYLAVERRVTLQSGPLAD
jgi:hypothetical protein